MKIGYFKNIKVTDLFLKPIKVNDAFCNLLTRRRLVAPLHTLNQNRSSGLKLEGKNLADLHCN